MQPERPLLTIAIPTYNRSAMLTELLHVLTPQIAVHPGIELLIHDNASPDETPAVAARFASTCPNLRYLRHPENIGSDANFVSCFHAARGRYFWLCGDDDIIVPGAVDTLLSHLTRQDFDLIYATNYGFKRVWAAAQQADPLGRRFHIIRNPREFASVVNIMFTFISGMIVNKQSLEALPHEDPSAFIGTNLTQLSWTLPLLSGQGRFLVLWDRPVAGRIGNTGGYSFGQVFGERLVAVLARCLPARADLVRAILNPTLRRWLPGTVFEMRRDGKQDMGLSEASTLLQHTYRRNPRFWIFTYPVLHLPLAAAHLWLKATAALSKLIYVATIPRFWRKES